MTGRARAAVRWLAALGICLVTLGVVFDLSRDALQRPFAYRGETMFYHVVAKGVAEHGWFLDLPLLGTPGALDLRDIPTSDNNAHVLIFQLPFMPFHEVAQTQVMRDYDLLRGYLHSTHLRWSYGTIRGREGNARLRRTATLPVDELVDTLAWAGFSGIYIDRHGFADGADALQRGLETSLGAAPLYSADRELVFYGLTGHRTKLESATPPADRDARRDAALHPPLVVWREGFYGEETDQGMSWRWARSRATLILVNRSPLSQEVRLRMQVTPNVGGSRVMRSSLLPEPIRVERHDTTVDRRMLLPPGRHEIYFESDAPRLSPPNDFREVVFEVRDLELQRVSSPNGPLRVASVQP